jgi:cytochrome P450
MEHLLRLYSFALRFRKFEPEPEVEIPSNPKHPEDFQPLKNACFQNPFPFYKMLREQYPIYQLKNGVYCISRFEDIVQLSRDTEAYSSSQQGAVAGLKKGQSIEQVGAVYKFLGEIGLVPVDVLATDDPPMHTTERKVGHKGLNARFVKEQEANVEKLCKEMMDEFIDKGELEFMQSFAWRLPMKFIIGLLGLPADDYEKIKNWCVHGISSQSGISTAQEMWLHVAEVMVFVRYCWSKYLEAKKNPQENLMGILIDAANNPDNEFSDKHAVSTVFQLLIAGSDSSATSMGNALKMLIENPKIQNEIREDMNKLPAFIEEVFRLESAFQGHFRWTKEARDLGDVHFPKGSRIFLMWASGNRDESMFENADQIILNRPNGKKHLTFGHGIHACLGRELARMEIRIVLREFLTRTENLQLNGEAPFIASMFARTLLELPIRFDKLDTYNKQQSAA